MKLFRPSLLRVGVLPPPIHFIFPLHTSYLPSPPLSTARLARYSYLYSPMSPLSPSNWSKPQRQCGGDFCLSYSHLCGITFDSGDPCSKQLMLLYVVLTNSFAPWQLLWEWLQICDAWCACYPTVDMTTALTGSLHTWQLLSYKAAGTACWNDPSIASWMLQ